MKYKTSLFSLGLILQANATIVEHIILQEDSRDFASSASGQDPRETTFGQFNGNQNNMTGGVNGNFGIGNNIRGVESFGGDGEFNFATTSTAGAARAGTFTGPDGIIEEGPGDASSLIVTNGGPAEGVSTVLRNGAGGFTTSTPGFTAPAGQSIDLNNVGDTVAFSFAFNFVQAFDPTGGSTTFDDPFTLFEIGLTNNNAASAGDPGDVFGAADSFFIAGTNVSGLANDATANGLFDLVAFNESVGTDAVGLNAAIGAISATNTLVSDLTLDAVAITGNQSDAAASANGIDGVSYVYNLAFQNIGGDEFRVFYELDEFDVTGLRNEDTVSSTGAPTISGSIDIEHGLDDLEELTFGFGLRSFGNNNPVSGASFDSNATFAASFSAIPEPSSLVLFSLAGVSLLARRKRA